MPQVILFDDGQADLGPLSDLRASFEQRTGALTALERWQRWGGLAGVASTPGSRGTLSARMGRAGIALDPAPKDAIRISGRLDVTPQDLAAGNSKGSSDGTATGWTRPWHLLDAQAFGARLERDFALIVSAWQPPDHGLAPSWTDRIGPHPVHIHASATLGANTVLDASAGPILIDEHATVRHGAIIIGPAYVGPHSTVADRAHIKSFTSIGPHCKVGGEVGSAIFQGFSNKVHDGHLGDALVGEWVNIGAGSVNSNLLNTYGEVVMRLRPGSPLERTGRQFMGCIVGDHTKLAIGTCIMTGTSIGTGTMWAATAPITGAVDRFRWVTDDGERTFQRDKFLAVARSVMGRRSLQMSAAEESALSGLMEPAQNRTSDRPPA